MNEQAISFEWKPEHLATIDWPALARELAPAMTSARIVLTERPMWAKAKTPELEKMIVQTQKQIFKDILVPLQVIMFKHGITDLVWKERKCLLPQISDS